MKSKLLIVICLYLGLVSLSLAQDEPLHFSRDDDPVEQVIFVSIPRTFVDIKLETTVYKPDVPGPWPLVVLNHGMAGVGDAHLQGRYRPKWLARFFLDRGYLVVAPMREGFSRSTGNMAWNCDHIKHATTYAKDVTEVVDYFIKTGDVRTDQILVVGQSAGGLVTLAYGADAPRAKAIINFAGGVNSKRLDCPWEIGMIKAGKEFGARTKIPALWIYTEDDAVFPPSVSKPFFAAYQDAGATATYKLYPHGGHPLSYLHEGINSWGHDVVQFLRQAGLPADSIVAPVGKSD